MGGVSFADAEFSNPEIRPGDHFVVDVARSRDQLILSAAATTTLLHQAQQFLIKVENRCRD